MTVHHISDFFPDTNELKGKIATIAGAFQRDPRAILPKWIEHEADFFEQNRFIICGANCADEIKALSAVGRVLAIVDDQLCQSGQLHLGLPVISTSEWISTVKADRGIVSCLLVAALRSMRFFTMQCAQFEFRYITPLQFVHLLRRTGFDSTGMTGRFFHYGLAYFDITVNQVDEHLAVADVFADNFSKVCYLNLLLFRLTLNPMYLEPFAVGRGVHYDYNTYLFEKSYLRLGSDEIYVDAGAFTGDSIEAFVCAVKGQYRHIYSFEPGAVNNQEIQIRLARMEAEFGRPLRESMTIVEKGVWSSTTELQFSPNLTYDDAAARSSPLGGHLLESGLRSEAEIAGADVAMFQRVPVTTIDEATAQDATFIKYEVEGSELEALKGARQTIMKNRPKLAVAVYHKPEDLLTLPQFILEMGLDYQIGFRQHDLVTPEATYIYCY